MWINTRVIFIKKITWAGCQWLTSIILATTQEAEIRRIVAQSWPGEKV
jgi:hypothetical protein